jgi:hypothetical protein
VIPTRKQRLDRVESLARIAAQIGGIEALPAACSAPDLARAFAALQRAAEDVVRITASEIRFLDLSRDIMEDRS